MALSRSRGSTSPAMYPTVAFSVARFTLASATPSFLERARSTRRTQEAQLIPVTGIVTRSNRFFPLATSTSYSPRSPSVEQAYAIPPYPICQGCGGKDLSHSLRGFWHFWHPTG